MLKAIIAMAAGLLQGVVRLFEFGLELLPVPGIGLGLNLSFLRRDSLEFVQQRGDGGFKNLKPLLLFRAVGLKALEAFTALAAALQQWSMGSLGRSSLRIQSRLPLFQLSQERTLLLESLKQTAFFASASRQGLAELEQPLPEGLGLIAITAHPETQPTAALAEASSRHRATFFKQFAFEGDGSETPELLPSTA